MGYYSPASWELQPTYRARGVSSCPLGVNQSHPRRGARWQAGQLPKMGWSVADGRAIPWHGGEGERS